MLHSAGGGGAAPRHRSAGPSSHSDGRGSLVSRGRARNNVELPSSRASRASLRSRQSFDFGGSRGRSRGSTRGGGGGGHRPATAQPQQPHRVVALCENRHTAVGLATIDLSTAHELVVTHIADSKSFPETISQLQSLAPREIIMCDTHDKRPLTRKVMALFKSKAPSEAYGKAPAAATTIRFVLRAYFDEDEGAKQLTTLASNPVSSDLLQQFTVMAASCALLKYVEFIQSASFAPRSLRVSERGPRGHLTMDFETQKHLEIVSNVRRGGQRETLFGVLDHTTTDVGRRLLRASLLSPPNERATIEGRLDAVTLLLRSEQAFTALSEALQTMPKLDSLLTHLALTHKTVTCRTLREGLTDMLALKSALELARSDALDGALSSLLDLSLRELGRRDPVLEQVRANLHAPQLRELANEIGHLLKPPARASRGRRVTTEQQRFEEVDAVHEGVDGDLDLARQVRMQTIEQLYALADTYRAEWGLELKVGFNASRGYYIHVPKNSGSTGLHGGSKRSVQQQQQQQQQQWPPVLPEYVVQQVQHATAIHCSTEEVEQLNSRQQEALEEVYLRSNDVLQQLRDIIRAPPASTASSSGVADGSDAGNSANAGEDKAGADTEPANANPQPHRASWLSALFGLSDAVALLDMLLSFAHVVIGSDMEYTRPVLNDADSPLAIKQGRHPVVEKLFNEPFVPNDIMLGGPNCASFLAVTGPNGAGKSTLLKTVAHITVLAHAGCFVPARAAYIPLREQLFTRIGTADDLESNVSTFLLEMRETAYILSRASQRSLVLVDELGRGTSHVEGLAIAWAVCEKLLRARALTLFLTHYHELGELQRGYPSLVRNFNLKTALRQHDIKFHYQLVEGVCPIKSDYGIHIAKECGMPADVIERASAVRRALGDRLTARSIVRGGAVAAPGDAPQPAATSLSPNDSALYERISRIACSTADEPTLRRMLRDLQSDTGDTGTANANVGASVDRGAANASAGVRHPTARDGGPLPSLMRTLSALDGAVLRSQPAQHAVRASGVDGPPSPLGIIRTPEALRHAPRASALATAKQAASADTQPSALSLSRQHGLEQRDESPPAKRQATACRVIADSMPMQNESDDVLDFG